MGEVNLEIYEIFCLRKSAKQDVNLQNSFYKPKSRFDEMEKQSKMEIKFSVKLHVADNASSRITFRNERI